MTRSNPARRLSLALLALALVAPGCACTGDRIMDFTDIIDVKYGTAIGAGAKVEITQYLGAGAGAAALGYNREWFGRRSVESRGFAFLHLVAIGMDGGHGSPNPDGWADERADIYFALVNATALGDFGLAPGGDASFDHDSLRITTEENPYEPVRKFEPFHPLDYWRFGGEVIIPSMHFGIYFNFGQFLDFFAGIATYDPAGDDNMSFFDTFNIEPDAEVYVGEEGMADAR